MRSYSLLTVKSAKHEIASGIDCKNSRSSFKKSVSLLKWHNKYIYNNGLITMADHKATTLNFLNALKRISKLIEQHKTPNVALEYSYSLFFCIFAIIT